MIMLRLVALTLSFCLLCGAQAAPEAKTRVWQEGQLISRKTIAVGRVRNQYVYRLRGSNARYLVVSDTPLKLDVRGPVNFSVGRRHIFIQDSDGTERKTAILEKPPSAH